MSNLVKKQLVVSGHLITYYVSPAIGAYPNLVFLHGWRSDSKVWFPVVDSLPENYNILAIDLPGFGGSEIPQFPFSVEDYGHIVSELLQKINFHKAIIIGHSFGGRIAIWLSAKKPELVSLREINHTRIEGCKIEKIVLIDSAGIKPKNNSIKFLSHLAELAKPLFKGEQMQNLRKTIYNAIGSADYVETPELKGTFVKIINEDLSPLLSQIKQETLIVWGEKDLETPLASAYEFEKQISNSTLHILKDAGHYSFIDQAREFVKIFIDFLNK